MRGPYVRDCRKHGLHRSPDAHADMILTGMGNVALLDHISDALEERLAALAK